MFCPKLKCFCVNYVAFFENMLLLTMGIASAFVLYSLS